MLLRIGSTRSMERYQRSVSLLFLHQDRRNTTGGGCFGEGRPRLWSSQPRSIPPPTTETTTRINPNHHQNDAAAPRPVEEVRHHHHTLQQLRQQASRKLDGSTAQTKLWRYYIRVVCDSVWAGLLLEQQHGRRRDDKEEQESFRTTAAGKHLETALGVGADTGRMPDFSNPAALQEYTLQHFGRVQLLADVLFAPQQQPAWWSARVKELLAVPRHPAPPRPPSRWDGTEDTNAEDAGSRRSRTTVSVASLGGGCGYDFIALAALSDFLHGPVIQTTVYDYEPAWHGIVTDVARILQRSSEPMRVDGRRRSRPPPQHDCGFAGCDITAPLDATVNAALAAVMPMVPIVTCSYVVNENAQQLRQTQFVFFQQVFEEAADGTVFIFTDTTHRLWPDLIDLARQTNQMRLSLPHIRAGKAGWQLVLLKDVTAGFLSSFWSFPSTTGTTSRIPSDHCHRSKGNIHSQGNSKTTRSILSAQEEVLYERFTRDNSTHLARLKRGWHRDAKKVRGAKK